MYANSIELQESCKTGNGIYVFNHHSHRDNECHLCFCTVGSSIDKHVHNIVSCRQCNIVLIFPIFFLSAKVSEVDFLTQTVPMSMQEQAMVMRKQCRVAG